MDVDRVPIMALPTLIGTPVPLVHLPNKPSPLRLKYFRMLVVVISLACLPACSSASLLISPHLMDPGASIPASLVMGLAMAMAMAMARARAK
ncbi:hypothetical protein K449DRAFT_192648 [Hypoxylon sp. EC38]|nr:hypothetical protein K449DRAFT_192648 [Hypoxylon sp. EC38]